MVQTPAPAPPASGQPAPVQPSADGTQARRLVLSLTSWTPPTQMCRCPRNRGNFIFPKEGAFDHITKLVYAVEGEEAPPASPAPLTEKLLIGALVVFALNPMWR